MSRPSRGRPRMGGGQESCIGRVHAGMFLEAALAVLNGPEGNFGGSSRGRSPIPPTSGAACGRLRATPDLRATPNLRCWGKESALSGANYAGRRNACPGRACSRMAGGNVGRKIPGEINNYNKSIISGGGASIPDIAHKSIIRTV